jgi:uncharacterized protein
MKKFLLTIVMLFSTSLVFSQEANEKSTSDDLDKKLVTAAEWGETAEVLDLIAKDADINAQDKEGRTPLILAAGFGKIETVRALVGKGANLNAKATEGYTALRPAVFGCHQDVVETLLQAGAVVDAAEKDAFLRGAAQDCQSGMVKLMLKLGADVNGSSEFGATPLMFAASECNTDVISLLLSAGARVNTADKKGRTALIYVASADRVVVWLPLGTQMPSNQVWVGVPSSGASEELRKEATRRQAAAIKMLLDHGATVENKDADGLTAYDHATKLNNYAIAEPLARPPSTPARPKKSP